MAKQETDIAHDIMKDASRCGARLFKNVRGMFYTKESVLALLTALQRNDMPGAARAAKQLRQVRAGLQAPGASDLIGMRPLLITQEMVGTTIAVFSAVEVKTATGAAYTEQMEFIDFTKRFGGFAGIARNPLEALRILLFDR